MFALYVLAKFILYCAVCYALARSFRLELESRWMFSIAWGAGRFLLGLLFGLPIGILYVWLLGEKIPSVTSYIIAFGPIRIVEWALLFFLIARRHRVPWGARANAWVLGGAAVSMLTDGVAILTGANQIKFFC